MNSQQILEQADTCVKCGLCLPHCPTYRKCADEAESPRGRVALIQGLAGGDLAPGPGLWRHLDRCLECRACESACPSGVPVTTLVDAAREHRAAGLGRLHRGLHLLLLRLAMRPGAAVAGLRAYQRLGLQRLLRRSPLPRLLPRLARLEALLPPLGETAPEPTPASGQTPRGPVTLFPGCLSHHLERRAHDAAQRVLIRLGYRVQRPDMPCCCGALHRHDGFPEQARRERARVQTLFGDGAPLLVLASACQGELFREPGLAGRVHELTRFLADLTWPADLPLRPLDGPVLVHTPCTQRNTLRDPDAAAVLLRHIPGLEPGELHDNHLCCGAAGAYVLRQPVLSDALLADKLAHLEDAGPLTLVTTNTGCALHLAAGIRTAGLPVQVCHPVELIDRQLPPP